jgi:hypothetical protein
MVESLLILLAVVAGIVFVMRMDEDPTRWLGRQQGRSSSLDGEQGTSPEPLAIEAARVAEAEGSAGRPDQIF